MALLHKSGCWVDIFELSHWKGRHRRLFGPADLREFRSRTGSWGLVVDSLVVGAEAHVRLYRSTEPQEAATWLAAGQSVADLLERGIDDGVDSLQILDRPPAAGEPGYQAYFVLMQQSQKAH